MQYPIIDPIAFHIWTWPVRWYGLMYLVGFLGGWGMLVLRSRYSPRGFTAEQISDAVFYTALGAILGGRCGYMLFYDWDSLVADPLSLFKVWQGGMSFHGGFLGAITAMAIYARSIKKSFLEVTDFIAPVVPIGLAAGRLGNFINNELWGRVTDVPWGMVFPGAGDLPRHPSQLYEFALEGVLLFVILYWYAWKPKPLGAVSGLFALCYGSFRVLVECFREPDRQIGYVAFGWLTKGQLLSLPLIILGIALLVFAYRHKQREQLV